MPALFRVAVVVVVVVVFVVAAAAVAAGVAVSLVGDLAHLEVPQELAELADDGDVGRHGAVSVLVEDEAGVED